MKETKGMKEKAEERIIPDQDIIEHYRIINDLFIRDYKSIIKRKAIIVSMGLVIIAFALGTVLGMVIQWL